MSRQFDENMIDHFDIYGEDYMIVVPTSFEDLAFAIDTRNMLELYISGLMHEEKAAQYNEYLEKQNSCIKEFVQSLGDYDNSCLIGNINYYLKKNNLRIGELEQLIGVSTGYISRTAKENSAKKMSIDIVWKLAKLFDTDVNTLISYDLSIPRSNENLILRFLDKLCVQTLSKDIKWDCRGGVLFGIDSDLVDTGLFEEKDGMVIYNRSTFAEHSGSYTVSDMVFTCEDISKEQDLLVVSYELPNDTNTKYIDFIFINSKKSSTSDKNSYEMAFSTWDDIYGSIQEMGSKLLSLISDQALDTKISPKAKNIITNYIK